MSLTASSMLALGSVAPDFELIDAVWERIVSLSDVKSDKATLVMFICNHCPYVKHIKEELVRIANDYIPQGMSFVAISSNDIENYPEDAPQFMLEDAKKFRYPFPYLFDETQLVARAYQATCTPDFFLFDKELKLVYRGQLDDSRPGNEIPLTGRDIRNALDDMIKGNPISSDQIPSMGCNIKWK